MPLLVNHPPGRVQERQYICDVLLRDFLGLDYVLQEYDGRDVCVTLAGDELNRQLNIADVLFSFDTEQWLQPGSLPDRPLAIWNVPSDFCQQNASIPPSVPVIYGRWTSGSMFHASQTELCLGVDIFGGAFFMLTRYEESVSLERDSFDRFPADASLAFRERFLERPVVNEYLEILWAALKSLWPQLRRHSRQYRALVTHDVDLVSLRGSSLPSVMLRVGKDLVQRREPLLAARRLSAYFGTRRRREIVDYDPYNTFDFIMDVSERNGLTDAFYFIPGHSNPRRDATYDIGDRFIRGLIGRIHQRGHEIGYHASFETYKDESRTRAEFNRLKDVCAEEGVRQNCWGGRQHYLRWQNPKTWQNWEACGLDYDSSLSYAQHVGFRTGCCYEYQTMNIRTGERLHLRERPLVAMESSLLVYMGYSLASTETALDGLMATCRRYQGDFTMLWHNHMLVSRREREAYARIVKAAAEQSTGS